MRTAIITVTLALTALSAIAQQPAGRQGARPDKTFASAADVEALLAQAKSQRKDQPLISKNILQLAPYSANLEYRASVGPAAVHEKEAELFYVIDGSATIMTGGKLVDEKRTNAANLTRNGNRGRDVAKGRERGFHYRPGEYASLVQRDRRHRGSDDPARSPSGSGL